MTRAVTSPWIRRFHPADDARARLVCFPHAGGSAPFYFPVSKSLSPTIDVLAIQYPGRLDRRGEKCIDTIAELADVITPELRAWLDRPVALFGHSMGAILAFEVATRLEREGVVPAGLFVSGRRAPSRHREETVHLHNDERLITELKRLSGTDSQVLADEDMLRMILPSIRSDYRAAETYRYRPGPKLNCPIFTLIGDADPKVTTDEARDWALHTTAPFELQVFSGGHFYLNACATTVTNTIAERMAELTGLDCPLGTLTPLRPGPNAT